MNLYNCVIFYFRSLFKFEKVQMGLKLQNKTKNKKNSCADKLYISFRQNF